MESRNMGSFTTMSSKGQLTIPKDVRDNLNLKGGTRFFVTQRDGDVVAIPKNKNIADLAGIMGKPPKGAGASLADIDEAIGVAVSEDNQRIVGEWEPSK